MYTPSLRLLITTVAAILATLFFIGGSVPAGSVMLAVIMLMVSGYFLNGTVYLAWKKIKEEQYGEAERFINQTRFPSLLAKRSRGFYYLIRGLIAVNRMNNDLAHTEFTEALKYSARKQNNLSIIHLNLASIEVERGNNSLAEDHLKKSIELKHSKQLEPLMKEVKSKLSSSR